MTLTLFFGADRYDGAEIVLRLLAVTALTWCFRGVGEFVLLGGERARSLLIIAGVGTAITIGRGVPLVLGFGATGAAIALVIAELVMVLMLVIIEPSMGDRVAAPAPIAPALAVAVLTGRSWSSPDPRRWHRSRWWAWPRSWPWCSLCAWSGC